MDKSKLFHEKCQQAGCNVTNDMSLMNSCSSWHHGRVVQYYCDLHVPSDLFPMQYPGIKKCSKCLDCLGKEKIANDEAMRRELANRRY